MDKTLSYLVYSPPKSNSHGHGVRDRNLQRAIQNTVDSFVDNFNAVSNNKLQVTVQYDRNNEQELKMAHRTVEDLNNFLGPSSREGDGSGIAQTIHSIIWESAEKGILEILDYIQEIESGNILPLHHFWISCFYHYGKNDEPNGFIMCSIESAKLFVRLRLVLPFTIEDNMGYELLSKFQRRLPFKLNGKHFRRLGPGKNGYSTWKLDEETQKRLDKCMK